MDIDVSQYSGLIELSMTWGLRLISALAILIAGWVIGSWVRKRIRNIQKIDQTISSFLAGFARYAILAVSIVAVLGQFGIQTASLLAVLGAAGLAIGLALQGTLSNVASGVMMLLLRPFSVGDFIDFGGTSGTVKTVGLFGVELNTLDNRYIFAPNSNVWGNNIINFSRNTQRRQDIPVGISYDSDINKAIKTVQRVLDKEERIITTGDKAPTIAVSSMGDSSVNLTARIWTKTSDFLSVQWDLNKAIKEAMDKDGIDIPFPTRTLEIINPEALKG